MIKKSTILVALFVSVAYTIFSQQKPLEIKDFDQWQRLGKKNISTTGRFASYEVELQEGDGWLVITNLNNAQPLKIPRAYDAQFTQNETFLIAKIKPFFKELRNAKIKKLSADKSPKDSLIIVDLSNYSVQKFPNIASYYISTKASLFSNLLFFKQYHSNSPQAKPDSITTLNKLYQQIDSLQKLRLKILEYGLQAIPASKPSTELNKNMANASLFVYHLDNKTKDSLGHVTEFYNSPKADILITLSPQDHKYNFLTVYNFNQNNYQNNRLELIKNIKSVKQMLIKPDLNNTSNFVCFMASSDTFTDELKQSYVAHTFKISNDNSIQKHLAFNDSTIQLKHPNWQLSAFKKLLLASNGETLYFGVKNKFIDKDTSIAEIDRVQVDIWHHQDPYLQTEQLKNNNQILKHSLLSVWNLKNESWQVLQDSNSNEDLALQTGDEHYYYYAVKTDILKHQWEGFFTKTNYVVNLNNFKTTEFLKNSRNNIFMPSANGDYAVLFDSKNNINTYQIYRASDNQWLSLPQTKTSLTNEEHDLPDDAQPYGISKFITDNAFIIYDRYDMWLCTIKNQPELFKITNGRKQKTVWRLYDVDNEPEYRYQYHANNQFIGRLFNENSKNSGLFNWNLMDNKLWVWCDTNYQVSHTIVTDEKKANILFSMERFEIPEDLYFKGVASKNIVKISNLNLQQNQYQWGTVQLVKWQAYNQKPAEGLLYKPQQFNPQQKYPMIVYFYETYSENLHNYIEPAPTPSRLDIPYFVSNGYLVFVPDIHYKIGYPGKSAYNYIVSGTRALCKNTWVDSTRLALQGQSWGGYQIAYLITQTNLYRCAWAGAPVVNMFSAYGGIRWGTGLNRQFQYEKSQSRIGGTIWDKTNLFIENSPLFYLKNVKTPVVIMHNDADGSVPWYQGIEMFTALRRLNKPVWLLNYNGEDHNLVERKNRKDISLRQKQFFDYYLKGQGNPTWLLKGVSATLKGKDLGLGELK